MKGNGKNACKCVIKESIACYMRSSYNCFFECVKVATFPWKFSANFSHFFDFYSL